MKMITESDSFTTIDLGPYYAILPGDGCVLKRYASGCRLFRRPEGLHNSGTNPEFLGVNLSFDPETWITASNLAKQSF